MYINAVGLVVVAVIAIVTVVAFIMLYRKEKQIVKKFENFQTIVKGNMDDVFEVKLTAPIDRDMFTLFESEAASSFGKIKVITPKTDGQLKAMTDADIIISPSETKALTSFNGKPNTTYQSNLKIFNNTDRNIIVNTFSLRPFMEMNQQGNFTNTSSSNTAYSCVTLKKGEVTPFLFASKFGEAVTNSSNIFLASFGITDCNLEAA